MMAARFEAQARHNLAWEIQELSFFDGEHD
jgi:hypothetical protein